MKFFFISAAAFLGCSLVQVAGAITMEHVLEIVAAWGECMSLPSNYVFSSVSCLGWLTETCQWCHYPVFPLFLSFSQQPVKLQTPVQSQQLLRDYGSQQLVFLFMPFFSTGLFVICQQQMNQPLSSTIWVKQKAATIWLSINTLLKSRTVIYYKKVQ